MVPGSALDVLALPLLSTNAMHVHEAALTIVPWRRGFVLLMGIVPTSPVRGRISTGAPTSTPTEGSPAKLSSVSSAVTASPDSTVTMGSTPTPAPTPAPASTPASTPTSIPTAISSIPPFSRPVHLFTAHVLLSVVSATSTTTTTSAPPVIVVVRASPPCCDFNSVIQIRWAQAHISLTFVNSLVCEGLAVSG